MHHRLSQKIIEKYGGPINTAKDCELLSKQILASTLRVISSSTLRRFFGLLKSSSAISKYNYDTLAIFCGFTDFQSFRGSEEVIAAPRIVVDNDLLSEIKAVTDYTLKSIERKSFVDFADTVPRESVNAIIDIFINSPFLLFPLVAPGGYGKSVALAHWVASSRQYNGWQVLFCPAAIYLQMSMAKSQQSPMVLDPRDNAFFISQLAEAQCEKIVVVLDGVDEIGGDIRKLQGFMDLLFELLEAECYGIDVKVVLGVREATWSQLMGQFGQRIAKYASPDVAIQSMVHGYSNMPMMSVPEIRTVLHNLNMELGNSLIAGYVPYELMPVLQVPLNLHLYAQMFRKTKDLAYVSRSLLFREYVNNVVFGGVLGEQKQDIVYAMVEIIEQSKSDFTVFKNELKRRLPIHLKREVCYFNAYAELLMSGILQEERHDNDFGVLTTTVRFKHQEFFYFIATYYLVEKQNGIAPQLFWQVANQNTVEMAANTIATLYEIAYEREEYEVLADFCDLPEAILASVPVRFSVGASFRINNRIRSALVLRFAQHPMGQTYFFEQFVDTNYLFNNFVDRIKAYLNYKRTPESMLFGNTILFLSGFLGMQRQLCDRHLAVINSINVDAGIHPWPIGRKVASNILYYAMNGNGGTIEWDTFVFDHQALARKHPAYLESGLVAFEVPVMIVLAITKKYDLLYALIERVLDDFHTREPNDMFYALLAKFQNSLPYVFMLYAGFKLGKVEPREVVEAIQPVVSQYGSAYDDFLFVILLNWFLSDCFAAMGDHEKCRIHHNAAFELSKFADYRFLMASLLINNVDDCCTSRQVGLAMAEQSGFGMDMFL